MNRSWSNVSSVFGLGVVCMALFALTAAGAMFYVERGTWPSNWPEELERFRDGAFTVEIAHGLQAEEYHLWFDNREEFDSLWPVLLRLKSKGAPVELRTPSSRYEGSGRDPRRGRSPDVVIHGPAPMEGAGYRIEDDGTYTPVGPWLEDVELRAREAPKYVGQTQDGEWIAYYSPSPSAEPWSEPHGFIYSARVHLILYVDGDIVDLNRIRFPSNTPVYDLRRRDTE